MGSPRGVEKALIEAGNAPGEAMSAELDAAADAQDAFDFGENVLERAAGELNVTLTPVKAGRKRGAVGRKTRDVIEALQRMPTHKDPLVAAAEIIAQGPHAVGVALGLKNEKAVAVWKWACEFFASYAHSKAPIGINVQGAPAVPYFFGVVANANENADISTTYTALGDEVAREEGRMNDASA